MGRGREVCHRKARESCQESRARRGDFLESKGLGTVRLGHASVQGHLPVQLMLSGQAARGKTTCVQLPGMILGPALCCCGCAAIRHKISTRHCPAAPVELRGLDGNFLFEELRPRFTAAS